MANAYYTRVTFQFHMQPYTYYITSRGYLVNIKLRVTRKTFHFYYYESVVMQKFSTYICLYKK